MPYESYDWRRLKNDPTESYFYLARQLAKCTMRADALNSDNYPARTERTGAKHIMILYIYSTDNSESKEFLWEKKLLQVCFTEE